MGDCFVPANDDPWYQYYLSVGFGVQNRRGNANRATARVTPARHAVTVGAGLAPALPDVAHPVGAHLCVRPAAL
jgi:hypothetical protein